MSSKPWAMGPSSPQPSQQKGGLGWLVPVFVGSAILLAAVVTLAVTGNHRTPATVATTIERCDFVAGEFGLHHLQVVGTVRNLTGQDRFYKAQVFAYDGPHLVGGFTASPVGPARPGEAVSFSGQGFADDSHPLPAQPACRVSISGS